jgi:sugar phosphate isomerase/epimerase
MGVPPLQVSIAHQALVDAGYVSPAAGLSDLGLAKIDLAATPSLELPGPDAEEVALVSVGDEASARAYRGLLYRHGVEVSALGITWATPSAAYPEQPARVAAAVRAAVAIGCPVVRLAVTQDGNATASPQQLAQGLAVDLRSLLEVSADEDIVFAVAWPTLGDAEPVLQRHVLHLIDAEAVGAALDPGRLYSSGMPLSAVYETARELAPRVYQVWCGNSRRPAELRDEPWAAAEAGGLYACELEAGDIDYARIASLLGRVGYSGAMTVAGGFRDGVEAANRRQLLRRDVAYMKDILGAGDG